MKTVTIIAKDGERTEELFSFPAQSAHIEDRGLIVKPVDLEKLSKTLVMLEIKHHMENDLVVITLGDLTAEIR